MAELTVSAHYETNVTKSATSLLKLTFPVWGVIAPIVGGVTLFVLVTSLFSHSAAYGGPLFGFFGMAFAYLVLSAFCLLAMRILMKNQMLLDKNGIQFPILVRMASSRYVPWASIRKIDVLNAMNDQFLNKSLIFYLDRGRPLRLSLKNMQPTEVEQLLLAIEMWGTNCEKDPSLNLLQDSLKINTEKEGGKLSYTTMWEEELRRRFSSTTFLPLAPGQIIRGGKLKVVRQLSLGGLSAVYLAQLDGNRLVVLKEAVLPEDGSVALHEKANELFAREATLLMRLKHKGIVEVLEQFSDNNRNYLMLEYVNGQDLRQFVKQNGAQKEAQVLEWAVQLAGILKYLHEQDPPIIHRDVSPDNLVLREDGSLVVIDFGAANEFISKATGTFVGKQSFIAPEQFRGKAVTQSDIYSFGCSLHYLLTGKEPEALSTSNPKEADVSDELSELVVSCTQMEPRDRYQTAAQLLPVLRRMSSTTQKVG